MKTSKSIATISYNTVEFLVQKLEELRKAHKIEFWFAMPHKPEDDECKGKPHSHVWIQPAVLLQTMDLQDELKECVPGKKELGCISFWNSKVEPAFLYWLHDERYLASIGESRKYHYSIDEMLCPDPDELDVIAHKAQMWFESQSYAKVDYVKEKIREGLSDEEIVTVLNMPIQYTLGAMAYVSNIRKSMIYQFSRNGRKGHEDNEYTEDES